MKIKAFLAVILACILGLTMALFSGCDGGDNVLVMGTEPGFKPYEYKDGTEIMGVDVDIANEIAKALGKTLKIEESDFDGVLLSVQQGKIDFAAAGISVTEERKQVMDFSIEYAVSKNVIIVLDNNDTIKSGYDITTETIVGVQEANTAQYFLEDEMEIKPKTYQKFLQAAEDLKNGKIDCIVMDSLPAAEMVAVNPNFKILEEELFTDTFAIAVKKGNTELLNKINEVIQKLIDEGKIDQFTLNHTTKD